MVEFEIMLSALSIEDIIGDIETSFNSIKAFLIKYYADDQHTIRS